MIPIRFCGYKTQTGKFERRALITARKYFHRMLGQYEDQIKEIKIIGFDKPIGNWRWGYHWLYRDGIVTIVLPRDYRGRYRSQWLIVHEMAHVAQLLSGKVELTPRAATLYYNGRPYVYDRRHKPRTWRDPAGRRIRNENLPWEAEVAQKCLRVFRREQYHYKGRRKAA